MVKPPKRSNNSSLKKAPPLSASERYKQQMRDRAWGVLNYMTVPLASALTFAWAALCEFLLYKLVWGFMQGDLQNLPQVKTIAELAQIAIFGVSLIGMLVHTGFSLYGTFLTEKVFAQEDTKDET
jgi:hypothetical protein